MTRSLPPPPGGAFPPPGGAPFQLPPNIPPPPGGFAALAALGIPPPPGGIFPPHLGGTPLPGSPYPPTGSGAGTPGPPGGPAGYGAPGAPPGAPTGPAALQGKEEVPSSAVELKPGTLLVYGDNEVSPEEKRARLMQYRVEEEGSAVAEVSGAAAVEADGTRKRARATDLME